MLYYKYEDNTHIFSLTKDFSGEKVVIPNNHNKIAAEILARIMFKL